MYHIQIFYQSFSKNVIKALKSFTLQKCFFIFNNYFSFSLAVISSGKKNWYGELHSGTYEYLATCFGFQFWLLVMGLLKILFNICALNVYYRLRFSVQLMGIFVSRFLMLMRMVLDLKMMLLLGCIYLLDRNWSWHPGTAISLFFRLCHLIPP